MPPRGALATLSLSLLAACSSAPLPVDGGLAGDAGSEPPADAGLTPDAGPTTDAGDPDAGAREPDAGFEETPEYDPPGELCAIDAGYAPTTPEEAAAVDCRVAAGRFAPPPTSPPPARLRIVAFNVHYGDKHTQLLADLTTHPDLRAADVLLLSEVARHSGSSNPPGVDEARDFAQALKMNYVFGVEWDWRLKPAWGGEHGVAILSRFPIGAATMIRHTQVTNEFERDKRYGSPLTLGADLLVGGRRLRIYGSHFTPRGLEGGRAVQGGEVRADALLPGRPAAMVAGGDWNTYVCNPALGSDCTRPPAAEQVVEDFLAAGWTDANAGFNGYTFYGLGVLPERLDWLFARGIAAGPGGVLTSVTSSDHRPLWSSFDAP